jgi:hypothetical protein
MYYAKTGYFCETCEHAKDLPSRNRRNLDDIVGLYCTQKKKNVRTYNMACPKHTSLVAKKKHAEQ